MYRSERKLEYAQRPGYAMVRIPYGEEGRYAIEIMLPDPDSNLRELLSTLGPSERIQALEALTPQQFDLAIPRFELTWG